MLLGMEAGLGPGHIVLDWEPAPPKKGHSSPQSSAHVCCGQTAGWIKMVGRGGRDQDGGRPQPMPDCVRWGPSSSTEMDTAAPTFRSISVVTKRLPILVTAELLYCVTLLNHYLHHTVVSFWCQWKFISSCRMSSAVKLMSLFVACRCYCKFSDDEFQRKSKLEMIIKYIEYGLQGLDVFSAHCLYFILVHYAHWITSTIQPWSLRSNSLKCFICFWFCCTTLCNDSGLVTSLGPSNAASHGGGARISTQLGHCQVIRYDTIGYTATLYRIYDLRAPKSWRTASLICRTGPNKKE